MTRRSAGERREELVEVALRHFAQRGYAGASTDAIAADAGISQPYLFRLFRTKRELFLACHEVCHERIAQTFRDAAAAAPAGGRLERMGEAYTALLADRTMLQFQLQSYAASGDEAIRERVRARYGELIDEVARISEASDEDVWRFFAAGMLLNVAAALGLEQVGDAWERA